MDNFRHLGTSPISADLAQFLLEPDHELWDRVTVRQSYAGTAHSQTRTIFLRGPARPEWDCIPSIDTYGAAAMPDIYENILAGIRSVLHHARDCAHSGNIELGRIMLVELAAGGAISEHTDEGAYAEHYERFHVALTNSPQSSLTVGGEKQHFAPGQCWWFNHRLPHSASNLGDSRRVHLIFDAAPCK